MYCIGLRWVFVLALRKQRYAYLWRLLGIICEDCMITIARIQVQGTTFCAECAGAVVHFLLVHIW